MAYPAAIPPAGTASSTATLAAAGHTSLHNTDRDEIRALATKIGIDGSADTASIDYRLSELPPGELAVGKTATQTVSNKTFNSTTLNSPTLTTPTIADFTNSTHTHASNAQGGLLNAANAITDGTLTPAELVSGTGSTWTWQTWTPTFGNLTGGTLNYAKYIQIGRTIHFRWKYTFAGTDIGGAVTFTTPTSITSDMTETNEFIEGVVSYVDTGTAARAGEMRWASSTTVSLAADNGTTILVTLSSTVPHTWAATDVIAVSGTYESA